MFNLFKSRGDHIPNKHLGETKKMGIMEDDYTIAERKARDLASLRGQSPADTFIDANGDRVHIGQLNGQTEQLLKEARESISKEKKIDTKLGAEEDINDNFPPAGKLNKKFYKAGDDYYDPRRTPVDNFKTNSPAKRRLDVRQDRKVREEQKWTTVEREDSFYESDLVDEEIKDKLNKE